MLNLFFILLIKLIKILAIMISYGKFSIESNHFKRRVFNKISSSVKFSNFMRSSDIKLVFYYVTKKSEMGQWAGIKFGMTAHKFNLI